MDGADPPLGIQRLLEKVATVIREEKGEEDEIEKISQAIEEERGTLSVSSTGTGVSQVKHRIPPIETPEPNDHQLNEEREAKKEEKENGKTSHRMKKRRGTGSRRRAHSVREAVPPAEVEDDVKGSSLVESSSETSHCAPSTTTIEDAGGSVVTSVSSEAQEISITTTTTVPVLEETVTIEEKEDDVRDRNEAPPSEAVPETLREDTPQPHTTLGAPSLDENVEEVVATTPNDVSPQETPEPTEIVEEGRVRFIQVPPHSAEAKDVMDAKRAVREVNLTPSPSPSSSFFSDTKTFGDGSTASIRFSCTSLEEKKGTVFLDPRGVPYVDPVIVKALHQVMQPTRTSSADGNHEKGVSATARAGYRCPIFGTASSLRRYGLTIASHTPTTASTEVLHQTDEPHTTTSATEHVSSTDPKNSLKQEGKKGIPIALSSGQTVVLFNVEDTVEFPALLSSIFSPPPSSDPTETTPSSETSSSTAVVADTPASSSWTEANSWNSNEWSARLLPAIRRRMWKSPHASSGMSPTVLEVEATQQALTLWEAWRTVPRDLLGRPLHPRVTSGLQHYTPLEWKDHHHLPPPPTAAAAKAQEDGGEEGVLSPLSSSSETSEEKEGSRLSAFFLSKQMKSPFWLTVKQIRALGFQVKKEEQFYDVPVPPSPMNETTSSRQGGEGKDTNGSEEKETKPKATMATEHLHPLLATTASPSSGGQSDATTTTTPVTTQRTSYPKGWSIYFNASQLEPHPSHPLDARYTYGVFLGSQNVRKTGYPGEKWNPHKGLSYSFPFISSFFSSSSSSSRRNLIEGLDTDRTTMTTTTPPSLTEESMKAKNEEGTLSSSFIQVSTTEIAQDQNQNQNGNRNGVLTCTAADATPPLAPIFGFPIRCLSVAGTPYAMLNTFLLRWYCQTFGYTWYPTAVFITPEKLRQRGGQVLSTSPKFKFSKTIPTTSQEGKHDSSTTTASSSSPPSSSFPPVPFTLLAGDEVITLWNVEQTSLSSILRHEAFERLQERRTMTKK